MLNRTIENLLNERDGFYVDCTTGGGGHLRALLHELNDKGRILAIDRDQETLERTAGEINDPG
jgi:16S rRNA (cytosine1402-N4)-methyltransferase